MKLIWILGLCLAAAIPARAIYEDSRVLTLSEIQKLGVQIEVNRLPGPANVRRHTVTVMVFLSDQGNSFGSVSYSILEKALDADFASTEPRKCGLRDAKCWAKEIRGQISTKPVFSFKVSDDEIPYGYLKVSLHLPPKEGIGCFGEYYLPLGQIIGH